MKKLICLSGVLLGSLALPRATPATEAYAITIHGRYYSFSDSGVKDVYVGSINYGGELTRRAAGRLDVSLEGSLLERRGELTFTRETTHMTLLRVAAGPRYRFGDARLVPYVSAGLGYFRFEESNVIGDVSKTGLGALAKAGVLVKVARRIHLDLGLAYSHCRMQPADLKINVGGLEAGAGLGLRF